jgi:hypothetical protein
MKKKLCLLLAVVMMLALLAGCGQAETQLVKCARATSKVQTFRIAPEVNMEMNISILGQEQNLTVTLTGDGNVQLKPFEMSFNLHSDSEEIPMDMQMEIKKTDTGVMIRNSMDGGNTWTESEKKVDWSQSKFKLDAKTLLGIAQSAKELEMIGNKEIRASEATGYGYTITGDAIADSITDEIPVSGTDITISPELFRGTPGVKLAIWIDNKTNYITCVEADMSETMSTVMSEFVKNYLVTILQEQMGDQLSMLDALGINIEEMLELSIPTFTMSVEAYDYQ